jgi:NAD(P)-dependent dehydrogenase (short-subunit alcohol dehydrogenase family)
VATSDKPTVVITGANRGIGLEFARRFAADGWRVHAAVRDPARAADLKALDGDVTIHQVDVTSDSQVRDFADSLGGAPVDILINNAGVMGPRGLTLEDMDFGAWVEVLRVNALSPVRVLGALLPNLEAGGRKLVVNITSRMGSIGASGGGSYIYRSSKAALNAAMRNIALDLDGRLTIIMFHPGWVSTDMGGAGAPVTPQESVAGMLALIDGFGPADSGRFLDYQGEAIPW